MAWTFNDACVVTAILSPQCVCSNDDGDQSPSAVVSVLGNTITFTYSDGGMNPGQGWSNVAQPACVSVPGGTFPTPSSGTMT